MTALYRLDRSADGSLRIWDQRGNEYVAWLGAHENADRIYASYNGLAVHDQHRADDYISGVLTGLSIAMSGGQTQ